MDREGAASGMADLVPVKVAEPGGLDADVVAVPCFEGEPVSGAGLTVEQARAVARAARRPGWTAAEKQVLHAEADTVGGTVVALYGLGRREALDARRSAGWLARVVEDARGQGVTRLAIALPAGAAVSGGAAAERTCRGLALSGYRFDRYRKETGPPPPAEIQVLPPAGQESEYRTALALAGPIAGAVAWTRDLANAPPNEANPDWMVARARGLAEARGMRIRVLEAEELAALGMGGVLAVGSGSSNPPRLVELEWGAGERSVALVGKGITFDTGGISIKPAKAMDEMKYDKSGACAVLGIARAAAELALPFRFHAYLPLAENMPDGGAYRPGDIVRCYGGKTVEIVNTDAEGRIILADALALAAQGAPDVLFEYSTLTGACAVALGPTAAGFFTPSDELAGDLERAAEQAGERLWRLPLWPEFAEEMKGTHADLRNAGGRWGGASLAAAFLANFMDGARRWAHFDIAGPAYVGGDQKGPKGATGYGVALTVRWLLAAAGHA